MTECQSFLVFRMILPAVLASALTASTLQANPKINQTTDDIRPLVPGSPIERKISWGEAHQYWIALAAGQFLEIALDQQMGDLIAVLFDPAGQRIAEHDSRWQGIETVLFVAPASGPYRLTVRMREKLQLPANYTIEVKEPRLAVNEDADRVAAESASTAAKQLLQQETAESRPRAIEQYQQALALWRRLGDRAREARMLNSLGYLHVMKDAKRAREYYEQALSIFREIGDRIGEAETLHNIGYTYASLVEKKKYYELALERRRAAGDRRGEAWTLGNLCGFTPLKAIECLSRALELARETGDPRAQGQAHNGMGFFTKAKGEPRAAIESFLRALQLFREAEDRGGEAAALNNLGQAHAETGETRKAIAYFEQAAPLLPDLGDRRVEAALTTNLGTLYSYIGEPRKAIEYYARALSLCRHLEDRNGEATVLNNLGQIHAGLGDRQQALECFDQSLSISRQTSNRQMEATTLNNIGNLYNELGEPQKAIEYLTRAGEIFRAIPDRFNEGYTLGNLGVMHTLLGQAAKAIELLRVALALRQQTGDRRGEAYTRSHLGLAHHALGDERSALEQYSLALALARSAGDLQAEAYALSNLGGAYAALKELEKARESYRQALLLWRSLLGRQPEATTLGNLAEVERDLGRMDAAREHFRAALDLIESMRTNLASQELRGSYLASAQNLYQLYIDLLVRMDNERPGKGFAAEALHASERARARGLMELLTEAHYEIKQGIDPALQQREQALHARLSWLGAQLDRARTQPRPDQKQIATLAAELKQAESERRQLETEIRRGSPKYAELFYPEPPRLDEIRSLLDERTALLEYAVGAERSYLFVVDREGLKCHRLPAGIEIERQVEELRAALLQTGRLGFGRYVQSARRLYEMLIAPAARDLGGKRNLIVVPEGKLHFLPFESLLASEAGAGGGADHRALDYLLKRWTVSYAPSAGVLAGLRQNGGHRCPAQHPVKQFVAFADPAASGYKPLPDSSREATGIAKLFRPDETAVYLREEASEEKVKASEHLLCARRVHFAAHGEIRESEPQNSALVLRSGGSPPEDGRLRTYEIFNLRLGAELVVLSACESGLGRELKGEGVIGLARAFLYAGTASAAVSLWQVPDRSTADLMVRFYQHLKNGRDNAAALRRAKIELIEAGHFANPHYWAPFVLIGETNQRRER